MIAHAVGLYFRFPLSLRMVEDLLAERIIMPRQTVWAWARDFRQEFAKTIRQRSAGLGQFYFKVCDRGQTIFGQVARLGCDQFHVVLDVPLHHVPCHAT